jgi:hypothetical protein
VTGRPHSRWLGPPRVALAAIAIVGAVPAPVARADAQGDAAGAAASPGVAAASKGRAPLPVSVRVAPDTVRIGQSFMVVVRLRVPLGATVTFPVGPDSGTAVEALDPRVLANAPDSVGIDVTASYRLAAWDLGRQPIGFPPITVHGAGGDVSIPLDELTIVVAPTTPADAAHRVPRSARPMFAPPRSWWPWWAIAAAILLGLVTVWLIAGWRRSRPPRAAPPIDAFAEAIRDFGALERVGLLEAGEAGRYVTLSVDVARTYLVRRLAPASLAQTTVELMGVIGGDSRLPTARLHALLAESDRVRFARQPTSPATARALGAEARRVVEEVERRATAAGAHATPLTGGRDAGAGSRGHAA